MRLNDLERSAERIRSGARRRTTGAREAFTLVEMVVVIAIIGTVAAAAAPLLSFARAGTVDDAVSVVTQLLGRARGTALDAASDVTVTVDPASHRAWIRAPEARPALDTSFTLTLPVGAELSSTSPRPSFRFDATGRASGEALVISTPRGRSSVSVDPFSGDVRVSTVGVNGTGHANR